ncbi:hypothetical protein CPC735_042210 [Coccidioides posadasii C735 delta SOWgp]|uniref:Uncharacterized protein n=1 Tax=Coccidioides posadasii (strain C735) TaxID=222929 RepID=C5PAZ3_COCP7|nr:hypothetical protein CPC735_042210 [Coccidioides posadasii C735 delta SOWgp]EER25777.1 hypothetical protein CPC735_042210 [Coccidioides posadasii C735 delta SOWgp]|eukprot:XP_003067922.1 hypothetical protein CPC735_042210 [Coccidioides posadasii C735 delta SOWgp]
MFTVLKIQCIPKMMKENLVLGGPTSFVNLAMSKLQALCYPMEPMVHAKRSNTLCYPGLGAISDALVGQIRWDNPMVIEELNILFGSDDKKAQDFINNWHLKTMQIALNAIVKTYQIEKKAFGNKFYWHCVHNNIDPVSVWSSSPPENLMEEEDHNDHY